MLIWPPNLRTLTQFIFILLGILLQNDMRKGVSFQKKICFQKMVNDYHCHHHERDDQNSMVLEGLKELAQPG
jgi:hypothetical protein